MRFVIVLCVGFVLASIAAVPAVAAGQIDMAALVTAFDQIVLREQGRVAKWTRGTVPLSLKLGASFGTAELNALQASLATITANTDLSIGRDDTAEHPDFLIEWSSDLGSPFAGAHNVGRTRSSFSVLEGELSGAHILILRDWNRGDAHRIDRTLPHEMLHAVGFHGHSESFDSVMTLGGAGYGTSRWDELFLRVLYDPRLPVGTPRIFALPVVCTLLHERLIAEGNTDVADLNRSGPHPYCRQLVGKPVDSLTAHDALQLAWAYLKGLGTARSIPEAEKWARLAAQHGDPDAAYVLQEIGSASRGNP